MMMCPFSSRSRRCASTPNGPDTQFRGRLHQGIPQCAARCCRDVDLVAQFADETDAHHARRHAGHLRLAHAEVRERRLRQVDRGELREHLARLRSGEIDRRNRRR